MDLKIEKYKKSNYKGYQKCRVSNEAKCFLPKSLSMWISGKCERNSLVAVMGPAKLCWISSGILSRFGKVPQIASAIFASEIHPRPSWIFWKKNKTHDKTNFSFEHIKNEICRHFPFDNHRVNCKWKSTFDTPIFSSDWLIESV